MTHPLNKDYRNCQDPNGIITCDKCGTKKTVAKTAVNGGWEFFYDDSWELYRVLCVTCNNKRLKQERKQRVAHARGVSDPLGGH